MEKKTAIIFSSLAGGLLLCQAALAADYTTSLGLGVGMAPDYEGSEDYTAVPLVLARIGWGDGDYVMLKGTQLKWNLWNDQIEFGPLLQYRMGRDDVENNQIDAMDEIDAATEAGFFVTGRSGPWSATFDFAADVSGEHDGYLVTLGGSYRQTVSEIFKITYGISTTYASDNYMDTYFSVDVSNRGTSTLTSYTADGGFKDVGLNVAADYEFSEKWSIVGNLGYKYLMGDAADSPIVDDEGSDGQLFLGAMGVYRF